jgi:hypothetical protein
VYQQTGQNATKRTVELTPGYSHLRLLTSAVTHICAVLLQDSRDLVQWPGSDQQRPAATRCVVLIGGIAEAYRRYHERSKRGVGAVKEELVVRSQGGKK